MAKKLKYSEWRAKVLGVTDKPFKLTKVVGNPYNKSVILMNLQQAKKNAANAEQEFYNALISQVENVQFETFSEPSDDSPPKEEETMKEEEEEKQQQTEMTCDAGECACPVAKSSFLQKYWQPISDFFIIAGATCALVNLTHAFILL